MAISDQSKSTAQVDTWSTRMTDVQVLAVHLLIIGLQALLLFVSPLNLSGDEAYYWTWSQHLASSYYEKGPGIAYLVALGCGLFGNTEFGVRFGALLCQFFIGAVLYFFTAKFYSRSAALLLLLLYWSSLIFASLGLFMTGDPPLCLFWLTSLVFAAIAVKRNQTIWWLGALTAVGIGALFKYTSFALLPSFGLLLLLTPSRRHHLRSTGFICGGLLLLLCLYPVLQWNSQHHWLNFAHNQGHLVSKSHSIRWSKLLELGMGQWGLIGPLLFPLAIRALIHGTKAWRAGDEVAGLYVWSTLPLALICIVVACSRTVYANWPMPLFLGSFLLLVHFFHQVRPEYSWPIFRKALAVNFALVLIGHSLLFGHAFGIPIQYLPTKKLVGWNQLGEVVDEQMKPAEIASRTDQSESPNAAGNGCDSHAVPAFVISEKYMTASEITFYAPGHPPTFVADRAEPRFSQYDIWGGWKRFQGATALMVFSDKDEWKEFRDVFREIRPAVRPELDIAYGSSVLQHFYFFRACGFNGQNLSAFKSDQASGE